jgi:hypothetical protein
MNENKLEKQLKELVKQFGTEPSSKKEKLVKLANQASKDRQKLEKSLNRLQESIDYLRVCIKYQLFDLEATKRENKYLRKLLEERDKS